MEIATSIDPVTEPPKSILAHAEFAEAHHLEHLTKQVRELVTTVNALAESHNRILALLDSLESQVGPAIQSISSGPIGKIMGL